MLNIWMESWNTIWIHEKKREKRINFKFKIKSSRKQISKTHSNVWLKKEKYFFQFKIFVKINFFRFLFRSSYSIRIKKIVNILPQFANFFRASFSSCLIFILFKKKGNKIFQFIQSYLSLQHKKKKRNMKSSSLFMFCFGLRYNNNTVMIL